VTNQDTGQSAVVSIQDRGPYIKGRIVDVSPAVADKLGMKEDGVVPVKVETLSVPDKDTGSKPVTESEKDRQFLPLCPSARARCLRRGNT
jgi:rare lipoprotein A